MSTLRFGLHAKKIENQVQANIITNNDDEALRILISDYEKKLRDLELTRQQEHVKYGHLVRQIEDLQGQKVKLMEKINTFSKLQVLKMSQTVDQDDLESFFRQARDKMIHFDQVGVVFNSQKLLKYELSPELLARDSFEFRGPSCFNPDLSISSTQSDSLLKFSMAALRIAKQQIKIHQKKVDQVLANMQIGCKRNIENYNTYLMCAAKNEQFKKQLLSLASDYRKILQDNKELKSKIDLFKDLKKIEELSDLELESFEADFWRSLDGIKMEKCRRMYAKNSMDLKKSIEFSPSIQKSTSKKSDTQSIDCEFSFELDLEESHSKLSLDRILSDAAFHEEVLNREEENFDQLVRQGLREIDEELAECLKQCCETESLFIEKKDVRKPSRPEISFKRNKSEKVVRTDSSPLMKDSNPIGKLLEKVTIDKRSLSPPPKSNPIPWQGPLDFVKSVMTSRMKQTIPKLNLSPHKSEPQANLKSKYNTRETVTEKSVEPKKPETSRGYDSPLKTEACDNSPKPTSKTKFYKTCEETPKKLSLTPQRKPVNSPITPTSRNDPKKKTLKKSTTTSSLSIPKLGASITTTAIPIPQTIPLIDMNILENRSPHFKSNQKEEILPSKLVTVINHADSYSEPSKEEILVKKPYPHPKLHVEIPKIELQKAHSLDQKPLEQKIIDHSKDNISSCYDSFESTSKSLGGFTGYLLSTLERQMVGLLSPSKKGTSQQAKKEFKDNQEFEHILTGRSGSSIAIERESSRSEPFPLSNINCEKEETIFSTSLFSMKNGERNENERFIEALKEKVDLLETLDSHREEFSSEPSDCFFDPSGNDLKKRRKRNERMKRNVLGETNQ